jgi:UDP-glucose 4-epimerase
VGIYNLGYGVGTSINQIYATLKKVTGYPQDATHGPAKVGESRFSYLSAAKAKADWGWTPTVDLETGLQKTVEYFRAAETVA